ncbi:MAG TPA: 16S rRNA (guanine(527)-N(7))-methyltransferase RsmG [Methylomirabilota bacterium]|nr:16S rRNA (guanine(527)-N(7))-methyltransferase RsmG [Methylomirabilota bacterium]
MSGAGRSPLPDSPLTRAIQVLTGRPASPEERARFRRYRDLLLQWNRTHHLTAHRSAVAIERGLFVDSLLFLPLLPSRPCIGLDIGAGAGIPGVPLRIVEPGIRLSLIESRRKAVSFLKALTRELGLEDVSVIEGRAEVVAEEVPDLLGKFDFVTSRAVGDFPALIPVALRFLTPGGVFLASGPPGDKLPEINRLGVTVQWRVLPYPALGMRRAFLVAKKPA